MKQLYEFWPLIVSAAAFVGLVLYHLDKYRRLDEDARKQAAEKAKADMLAAVRSWLLKAVTDAEAAYGDGTGKLKLQSVYEAMVDTFGTGVISVISMEQLDDMVQMPLAEMRKLLESNQSVAHFVKTGGSW